MSQTFLDNNPRVPILCPHCGKESLKLISQLIGHDKTACDWCQSHIQLDTEDWQAAIQEFAAGAAEIQILNP